MKIKKRLSEMIMAFFVSTSLISILEGFLGMIFFPEVKMDYSAFFSPPLLGFFSVLLGLVTHSKKEPSVKQVLFQLGLHLVLIEILVFGLNYLSGNIFAPLVSVVLALSIALVFVAVYVILWLIDQKSAMQFNERLKVYQQENASGTK